MIREKIFRLHRHKSSSSTCSTDASAQKFDFAFSNIQAFQVPKGWDKVTLSLISSESGKTVRKTGKVLVRNGTCQWTETFSESVWISGSKELEECLFKFVLAAGSSKSSTLGEFTVNLAAFLSSSSPMLVSLPLKKSDYGTILQVEVKCLTPRTNLRGEKWKEMNAHIEHEDHDYIESQSELSDSTSASNNAGSSSRARELSSRETSFSASVSRYSFDSMDDSQSFSSQSRQDSIESNDSSVKSVRSEGRNQQRSSKVFKGVDDSVVQELEATMWEQNARRLSLEVEKLRKEVSNQNVELDRSRMECREFSDENERLRLLLEVKKSDEDQISAWDNIHKDELEDEMKFHKEENENMSLQFKKTQESNIELISILQEMEETIEDQKHELLALEEKVIRAEIEQDLKNRVWKEFSVECSRKLAAKDEKIASLEDALTSHSDESNGDLGLMEHLSELQDENVYLSQRVSGLEAQLRYLTDKSESNSSELHHSEAKIAILESEIRRLEEETERRKIKLLEKEKQCEEAEEECTNLSKLNIMLQGTIESLIDEYNSLQSFNVELREQKKKLHERNLVLESFKNRENVDSELETKIKCSELERIRLAEENFHMHEKLHKATKMQNEVLALRVSVRELECQNRLLEASFKSLSEDFEEVKRENVSLFEKLSSMQRAVEEAEECTRRRNVLEGKVLRLEGDLIARDAINLRDVEIKHELIQMKIENSKLVMKVKKLEEIQSDQVFDKQDSHCKRSQLLATENELAKALKANDVQLKSDQVIISKSEDKVTMLEAELQEIRERYLQISMKYADVEAQREELVMKLKASSY